MASLYRGSWCPYCNAQLRGFQRARSTQEELGVGVAALSVDDKATTAELITKHKLTFPVGYGADAGAVAELTGAFANPDPAYLQSTGFVLDPDGEVIVSVSPVERSAAWCPRTSSASFAISASPPPTDR